VAVGSEQEAVPFAAEVVHDVRVTHEREILRVRLQLRQAFRHKVLVLECHHRQALPDHFTNHPAIVATGVDDSFTDHIALVGRNKPRATRLAGDTGDLRETRDYRSEIARALGKCLRQLARIDVAFIRVIDAAKDAFARPEIGMHGIHLGG